MTSVLIFPLNRHQLTAAAAAPAPEERILH